MCVYSTTQRLASRTGAFTAFGNVLIGVSTAIAVGVRLVLALIASDIKGYTIFQSGKTPSRTPLASSLQVRVAF